jgi:diguanylate cyclase (GGDEF)-like protein/PAS domain S-box-containing protein
MLQKASENNDPGQLAKIAHNFKSSCGNLGAMALAKKAANLESIGRQGQMHSVNEIVQSIANELPSVISALRKEMTTASGSFFFTTVNPITSLPSTSTAKILLIDDDPNFRDITSSALRTAGFIVDEVASGGEAIKRVKRQLPDLILLDANMPELDGFETCRQLKLDPALTDIPIIMATGMDDVDSVYKAFEAGASDFMPKPLNYSILIQRINFGLRTGQVTAELRNSKLQLTAAQRIARLGYWTWDSQRDVFTISEQLAELGGIDLKMFGGTLADFVNLVHPKDREFVKDVINAAGQSKAIQHIEYRINANPSTIIEVQQEIEALTSKNQLFITGIVQDISHKKQTEKQIHRLAYFDHLTGLANRSYYQERIEDLIKSAQQRKAQFAFMFIDMDGFKHINDTHGHHIGDLYLQEIAQRLKLIAREIDFIVRMGGDEFCIILNNITEESTVAEIAKRCLQKIDQPLMLDNHQIKPKASIGIALFPKDGNTEAEILKAADTAMYMAKQTGKNRYIFYSAHMANQVQQRLQKESMLRDASAKEQFVLVYQPQVSLESGKIVGVEALARWQHPEKGIISPVDFINLAEQLGLITQLGHWAIKTACEQIAEWHMAGLPYIQVGVNISPTYLQDPSLLDSIKSILERTKIPAEYLQLEITENGLQNVSRVEIFNQLREIGLKIAIDDFGSGFSSLASLKQLPLDGLKIDKMFIEDLLFNPHTPLLLGTIIGLANALNFTLVAEGVENKEQASVMLGLGCRIMQGFLFSRPVPGKEIPALYSTNFILENLGDYVPNKPS